MDEAEQIVIRAAGLRKSFKGVVVLDGVDLTVAKGTVLALLGPNGAGKTTAVKILSTLLPFDGGVATVAGYDVTRQASQVRSVMGITGQEATLDEVLTGYENLVMIGRLYHLGKATAKERARGLLAQFDLVDAGDRAVATYSGGMRRRLDLAASLIADPPVIFLDEPTTGLDPRSRLGMWTIIEDLVAQGTTILLTTQYLEEADRLADRIAVIDHGRIIAKGTADELKRQVGTERLELRLDGAADLSAAIAALDDGVQVDHATHRITIAVGGAEDVRRILNTLDGIPVKVHDLTITRPTLDDAFFSLTGIPQTQGVEAA